MILNILMSFSDMPHPEESQFTPALFDIPETVKLPMSLGLIPENKLLESYTRLSVSLEENSFFQVNMITFHAWIL